MSVGLEVLDKASAYIKSKPIRPSPSWLARQEIAMNWEVNHPDCPDVEIMLKCFGKDLYNNLAITSSSVMNHAIALAGSILPKTEAELLRASVASSISHHALIKSTSVFSLDLAFKSLRHPIRNDSDKSSQRHKQILANCNHQNIYLTLNGIANLSQRTALFFRLVSSCLVSAVFSTSQELLYGSREDGAVAVTSFIVCETWLEATAKQSWTNLRVSNQKGRMMCRGMALHGNIDGLGPSKIEVRICEVDEAMSFATQLGIGNHGLGGLAFGRKFGFFLTDVISW